MALTLGHMLNLPPNSDGLWVLAWDLYIHQPGVEYCKRSIGHEPVGLVGTIWGEYGV